MTEFLRATNKRQGQMVFSLGVPIGLDELTGKAKVPPKLVLEPGVNKIASETLDAQPAAIKRAWDDLVVARLIEVEPWTDAAQAEVEKPRVPYFASYRVINGVTHAPNQGNDR